MRCLKVDFDPDTESNCPGKYVKNRKGGDGGETVAINGVVIHRKEFHIQSIVYFIFYFTFHVHCIIVCYLTLKDPFQEGQFVVSSQRQARINKKHKVHQNGE